MVTAEDLYVKPIVLRVSIFPLQHKDWIRIRQIDLPATLFGAWLGLLFTTASPILQGLITSGKPPVGTIWTVVFDVIVFLLLAISAWTKGKERRRAIKIIDRFFKDKEV